MKRTALSSLLISNAHVYFVALILLEATASAWAANPVTLSIPLGGAYGGVREFQISPDGTRVLALQAPTADNFMRTMYTSPIQGGVLTSLTSTDFQANLDFNANRPRAEFTPDGQRVVFLGKLGAFGSLNDLHVVPSVGGTIRKVHPDMLGVTEARIQDFWISPDSQRVVFRHNYNSGGGYNLWSTTLPTTTATVRLNDDGNFYTVNDEGLQFSPDSSRVIWHQSTNYPVSPVLLSAPSGGGAMVNLDGTTVGQSVSAEGLAFSPNSNRVLFHSDRQTTGVFEIFSVLGTGGSTTKLSGTMGLGGDATTTGLQYSPDGSRVLYQADQTLDEVLEVFSVPALGGTPVRLNGAITTNRDVTPIEFSPDSSRVLYLGDQTSNDVDEIYTVPATGGANVKINGTLVAGGDVLEARYSPNGSRVVYLADGTTDEVPELYSTPHNAAFAVKLNHGLATGENMLDWSVTPNSNRVFYRTALASDPDVMNLFVTPMLGGTPVQVNPSLAAGEGVREFKISPDGRRVIYMADVGTKNYVELFSQALSLNWATAGGAWNATANWDLGLLPDEVTEVTIAQPTVVTVPYSTSPRHANKITLGGGAGNSVLELQDGAVLATYNGLELLDGAVLRGDGVINLDSAGLLTDAESEIRVAAGDRLRIASTQSVSFGGKVEVIGTPENPAEIEFDSGASNEGGGLITGRNAILRFGDGLYNEGAIGISFGTSDIFGDIDNQGDIVVSGGSLATFYDDINQDAILRVTRSGSTTSVAVFFGSFTGTGGSTGGGDVIFEGDLRPGNSPAIVTMENNVVLGAGAGLEIELGGLLEGAEYDRLNVVGALALGGALDVNLISGFTPTVGDRFDILDWNSLGGAFDTINLPDLSGLSWNTSQLYTTGTISVGLAGDFDFDGDVDGRDFLIWQRGGSPNGINSGDLADWQSNYGVGALTAASTAVPEPGSGLLVFVACAVVGMRGQYRFSIRSLNKQA